MIELLVGENDRKSRLGIASQVTTPSMSAKITSAWEHISSASAGSAGVTARGDS